MGISSGEGHPNCDSDPQIEFLRDSSLERERIRVKIKEVGQTGL